MIVSGTGHRPPRLGLGYTPLDRLALANFVGQHLKKLDGVTSVITGMAQGFDQALAGAALLEGLPLVAAIPFDGMEAKWPADAQAHFNCILGQCKEVVVVCDGGYAASKFIERDHWMVDHSDMVLALWDEVKKGGTWQTVKYAQSLDKWVVNLWGEYEWQRNSE